ncbi:DUF5666 domain-containing protein [Rubrivirga sp. IMCC45206]|uniref:DUF5666 domain-containing protein n=1 Tax=Rubrivirga sp. IMCC45206 TaxID=3391614 RepID=UPI00398FDFDE
MKRLLLSLALLAVVGCDAAPSDTAAVRLLVEGHADVSYTTPSQAATAVADGTWETRLDAAPGDAVTLRAVSRDGAPVSTTIEVDGRVVASDRGLSASSSARSGDDAGEVEVHGAVEAVDGDRLTVRGRVFVVDAQTRLFDRDNRPVPLATFAVGTVVEAEGHARADGTVRAKTIKLDDDDGDGKGTDEHEVEVEGRIDAIGSASITVAGTTFATDAATRWLDDDNRSVSRDAFAVGHRAEAEGWVRDGTLYAEKVKLDDD